MSAHTAQDVAGLKRVGRVVRETLRTLEASVKPGMTTLELDRIAEAVFCKYGAQSAPRLTYGFPGSALISINDEIVHGVPGERRLEPGDVISLDVTAELDGFIADAAVTTVLPPITEEKARLVKGTRLALANALWQARDGVTLREVGAAVEREARRYGLSVIPELCGHGVGRNIHDDPECVPNYDEPTLTEPLLEGMVITIEPLVALSSGNRFARCFLDHDGWTVKTRDKSLAAHFEHTLLIRRGLPLVLTA